MHLPKFGNLVSLDDRRIVGGPPTQSLLPMKYKWLYNIFKKANNNFWLPEEIGMGDDKYQYTTLPVNVRHAYDRIFSMLTTMDLIVTDALESSIMPHATAPEFRSWLALQGYQEAIHSHSYTLIAEEVSLDPDEVFGRYLKEKELYDKIDMAYRYNKLIDTADTSTIEGLRNFVLGYSFWVIVLEGMWFYLGLSAGTYPSRYHRVMRGTTDQFQYIRRDEQLHYSTGLLVIREILNEYPEVLNSDLVNDIKAMVEEGVGLEDAFADATYINLPGMLPNDYKEQVRFQARNLCRRLGIEVFPNATNAIPWFSESVDLRKETNFFERRVSEYQVAADLGWDEVNDVFVNDHFSGTTKIGDWDNPLNKDKS